jgi:hypothetical protein
MTRNLTPSFIAGRKAGFTVGMEVALLKDSVTPETVRPRPGAATRYSRR